jgi:hypothetical protein
MRNPIRIDSNGKPGMGDWLEGDSEEAEMFDVDVPEKVLGIEVPVEETNEADELWLLRVALAVDDSVGSPNMTSTSST